MGTRTSKSKKHLFQKEKAKYHVNCRIALQLYTFYKAETVVTKEPRLPHNDFRRPVAQPKRNISGLQYLKQQISLYLSSKKLSGSFNHQIVPSILKS